MGILSITSDGDQPFFRLMPGILAMKLIENQIETANSQIDRIPSDK